MKVGPYTLIEELGRGGMAQVFLAHRVWEDGKRRSCAFKFPRRSAVTDEALLRQFLEEFRLAILLRHNNIVSVFDAGVHEGLPYLVMDYVPGKDLAHIVRTLSRVGVPFDVETAVHVVRELGEALLYAHEFEYQGVPQQIVHRDVASKNVMIDGSGAVLLMDFGVATSLTTQTSRMHVKGTLPNMAPEHYLGQASAISDVFGLGTIFWELLAGRPFRDGLAGPELIAAVVGGVVEPVGRPLPPVVDRVLWGMLEPDAPKRMTLRKVLHALKDFPPRRAELREMMGVHFGRAGRRTGLSQIHYAASKELEDTLAVVKVAGISLTGLQRRRRVGQPDDLPPDFVPEAKEDTGRVDPRAIRNALDDDLDEPTRGVPAVPKPVRTTATDEPGAQPARAERPESDHADDPQSGVPTPSRAPVGTVRAPRAPMPAAVAPAVEEPVPPRATMRVAWSPPAQARVAAEAPNEPVSESDASGSGSRGDTLRSPGSGDPRPAPQATLRLPNPVVANVEAAGRTELLPPPAMEHAESPPSLRRVSERPSTQPSSARRSLPLSWFFAPLMLMVLGMTAWSLWPDAARDPRSHEAEPKGSSLAAAGETPAVVAAIAEPRQDAGLGPVEGLDEAPAGLPEVLQAPVLVPEPEPSEVAPAVAEPEPTPTSPAAEVSEPAVDPVPAPPPEPEPELVPQPQPAKADEDAAAKQPPRPPKPKPVPTLELVVRRGIVVDFGEVRVGRGKATTVPPRGAATLLVAPGTYTIRYRTHPNGEWKSFRYTFSSNLKYAGQLEHTGLRIQSEPVGGR
jgi:hypothetical protein